MFIVRFPKSMHSCLCSSVGVWPGNAVGAVTHEHRGRSPMALSTLFDLDERGEDEAANEPSNEVQRRHALREYLVTNYERLQQRLVRHLRCTDLASECLHDAWLRLGHVEVHAPVQSPDAYVYRMACNVAMDRMRSSRSWQYTGDGDAGIEHLADESPGPDHVAAARSDLAAVERALQRLPRRHRTVLVALRIDEMTRQEVAQRYALSLRSVDTALRQALDYCAEYAGQEALTGVSSPRRALRSGIANYERARSTSPDRDSPMHASLRQCSGRE
ncbi:RNA polymerase sigma factor (sigma-70 family) [Variovorax sp. W2I14]